MTPPIEAQPPSLIGKSVWVVDAHSLIFQVFHAIPEMTSARGEPTNAVYGFTRDILYLLEVKRPDYLFCAFDAPGDTFRHQMYEGYKADRGAMPEALRAQLPAIQRVLEVLNVASLMLNQFEADDLLATIARRSSALGAQCVLVTGDKDCRQLITEQVKVYNVRKDQMMDDAALVEDWGIQPSQVVDYQALVGDAVDRVPGVPLIGPKIARELLTQYGTLDEVLAHAAEVKGAKRRENLTTYRDQALLSRELVRLHDDAPIAIDWDAGRVATYASEPVAALFRDLGFRGLADKALQLAGASPAPAKEAVPAEYHTVDTQRALDDLVRRLKKQRSFSFDTETNSVVPTQADLVGLSFAFREQEGWYVPVCVPEGESCLPATTVLAALRGVLEDPRIEKIGQNLKYDALVLRSYGIELRPIAFDTMVASYLLEAGERSHSLDQLAQRYLDHTTIKYSDLVGTGKSQKTLDQVSVAQVTQYAAEDAEVVWRLRPLLAQRLADAELESLFFELETPLIEVLVEMEHTGIRVDVARLAELSAEYGRRLETLEREIYELAGHEFNIASPKQLQAVLFEELGLPIQRKVKTGASTDASVLEELARQHPLPAKIVEHRQFAKLKGTYVDALPSLVHPRTGRVHATFNQVVAATGRLSSSDPNLQNIPIRSEAGREIRSAFLPGHDDWALLAADYSQIELRILAHLSRDETLCAAFDRDEDIHTLVASQIEGVSADQVTSEMRRRAKAVNFGVIYGQSAFGLARQLNIGQDEAGQFIDAYFDRYPGVEEFLTRVLVDCRRTGYVKTVLGRRRAISGIRPVTGRQRNLPERTAINTVVQGSAADLIKRAMIAIHRRLVGERLAAKMVLQIHDELVFELPRHELTALSELVVHEMTGVLPLDVPLKVDLQFGSNWAEVETLD